MVFDPLLASLEHSRTTLCCVRCGKTVQSGLCVKHILWSKNENEQKHYCPFLKKMREKPEDDVIIVPHGDTSQPLFPNREKCEGKKRGGGRIWEGIREEEAEKGKK